MTSIGGFLGLETQLVTGATQFHAQVALSNARSCFALMLLHKKPRRLFFPVYICECMFSIIRSFGASIQLYSIDRHFEVTDLPERMEPGELFLYVNYFGMKDNYVKVLQERFGERLIVDDSQGFFRKGSATALSFNSARKFFGVADGAYCWGLPDVLTRDLSRAEVDYSHLIDKDNGLDKLAYERYCRFEESIDPTPMLISAFSSSLLNKIDYGSIAEFRRRNFAILHSALGNLNLLPLTLDRGCVPLYYPFLYEKDDLRERLIQSNIYVPLLWENVSKNSANEGRWESALAKRLCPLPIDQRYVSETMNALARIVLHTIES